MKTKNVRYEVDLKLKFLQKMFRAKFYLKKSVVSKLSKYYLGRLTLVKSGGIIVSSAGVGRELSSDQF